MIFVVLIVMFFTNVAFLSLIANLVIYVYASFKHDGNLQKSCKKFLVINIIVWLALNLTLLILISHIFSLIIASGVWPTILEDIIFRAPSFF
ncbi:MAG: hypothetical protein FWE37_08830 [Spirochaetaceae bacterium]|nr:hypothetical protein [Spirochaetaceae bacterium]